MNVNAAKRHHGASMVYSHDVVHITLSCDKAWYPNCEIHRCKTRERNPQTGRMDEKTNTFIIPRSW